MGLGKDWPWLVVTALFAGAALCIAAYGLGSGATTVTLVSLAIIALSLAQAVSILRGYFQAADVSLAVEGQLELNNAIGRLSQDTRRAKAEREALSQQLNEYRNEGRSLNSSMAEGLAELRKSHEILSQDIRTALEARHTQAAPQPAPQYTPAPEEVAVEEVPQSFAQDQQWSARPQAQDNFRPVPSEPEIEPQPFGDALNLSLEPIVDLFTSSTAHYRMVLGMTNEQGTDVPHEIFVHHADRMGLRDKLDVHVVEQALDLLVTLRQRDPNLCIFVPFGASTLANPQALQHVLAMMRQQANEASGLVIDIPHAVLASLPEASLEGLATLARSGVALSLSQASIAGVDLAALHRLNVRFVSLAASSIGLGGTISAGLPGFVQSARALRLNIIVSHVGDPRQVANLARTARYASGPAFASPRKLKRQQAAASQHYTAAA